MKTETQQKPMTSGIGSNMLARLRADTEAALVGIKQPELTPEKLASEIDQLAEQFKEVAKVSDEEQRAARTRILTATHESIIEQSGMKRQNLAKALANIDILVS